MVVLGVYYTLIIKKKKKKESPPIVLVKISAPVVGLGWFGVVRFRFWGLGV